MDHMFVEAYYNKEVILSNELLEHLKQYKSIALFMSIQFIKQKDKIKEQLSDIKIIESKPARADAEHQILGCDAYYPNLDLKEEPDAFLYIGDGMFHPQALLLAQKDNETMKQYLYVKIIISKSIFKSIF